jgi:hypothetical protein
MSKFTKIFVAGLIIIVAIVFLVQSRKPASNEKIRIGVVAPLTGVAADYGEEIQRGIQAAASSTPGFEFVFEDDKCDAKEAVAAFKKLVDFEKIRVIIGPACGSPQEAIIPLAKTYDALVLVPSAASRDLYAQSGDNFFNVQYSLENESAFIGITLTDKGYKKVALVRYQNAFSETHSKSFKAAYKGELVEHVLKDETSEVAPEVAKIKTEKVDAIYAPDINFFFGNGLVKLRQYGVTAPVYSTYVTELPAVRTLVSDVIYSFPGDLSGSEGAVFELSREAAQLAADTVLKCGDSTLCMKGKLNESGKFDEYGVYKRPIILKQIKDGKPEMVKL